VEPPELNSQADVGSKKGRVIGLTLAALVTGAIVALLLVGLFRPDQEFVLDRAIAENKAPLAPEVTLPVLVAGNGVGPEGAPVSLRSLRGKVVVVNLWASWCPPCRSEAPILQRLATKYEPRGVVVLGINVRDISGDARSFVNEFKLTFPSLRDGSDDAEQSFEVTGLPETFIVDPDGKMRILPFRGELTTASEDQIGTYLDSVLGS
jgi:cytochrome c biogenesis protein CcmG, thiol:disulfide interchange protein DsbE